MSTKITWETESKRRGSEFSVGDDLCHLLSEKTKIRRLPNRKFKRGLSVGFYYNSCGEKTWHDTEFRMPLNICCDKDAKYVDCETAIARRRQQLTRNKNKRN